MVIRLQSSWLLCGKSSLEECSPLSVLPHKINLCIEIFGWLVVCCRVASADLLVHVRFLLQQTHPVMVVCHGVLAFHEDS